MTLARFGHHPDPAIDFCIEVEGIEGDMYDLSVGLGNRDAIWDRVSRALHFVVGGDMQCIEAKSLLRLHAAQLAKQQ